MQVVADEDIKTARDLSRMFAILADQLELGAGTDAGRRALRLLIRRTNNAAFAPMTQSAARDLFLRLALLELHAFDNRERSAPEHALAIRANAIVKGHKDVPQEESPESRRERAIDSIIVTCRHIAPQNAARLGRHRDVVHQFLETRGNRGGRSKRPSLSRGAATEALVRAAGFPRVSAESARQIRSRKPR